MEMQDKSNVSRITATASTIAELLGVKAPENSEKPIKEVVDTANKMFKDKKADRVFMYNPDAVALWLFEKYTDLYKPLLENITLKLPVHTVMPSVTPVCFASMYTGVMPEVHGIQSYEKPVLKIETIFDMLIKSGKKPVIVSTEGDSISKIFLERNMDYFIYKSYRKCRRKAIKLVKEYKYDLIVLYNHTYDSTMHHHAPEGKKSIKVLKKNINDFAKIASVIKKEWSNYNSVLAFATDHGCHEIDGNLGSHGLDMDEDMYVMHFYSILPKKD